MKRFAFILAAVAALAACTEESAPDSPVQPIRYEEMVFSAGFDCTRTVRQADNSVWWSPQEEIAVSRTSNYYSKYARNTFTVGDAVSRFVSTNDTSSPTADFVGLLPVDYYGKLIARNYNYHEPLESRYWALYPYSDACQFAYDYAVHYLPESQTGVPDTFQNGLYIAVAVTQDHTLHFQHPLGGIKFSVVDGNITRALLTSNGELRADLCGKVYLDYDEDTGLIMAQVGGRDYESANKTIELVPQGGKFLPGHAYYFVTFPVDMETGFNITFEREDGATATRTITSEIQINKADFRTLMEADKGLEWAVPHVTVSDPEVNVSEFTARVMETLHSPLEYDVTFDCDWLMHDQWDQYGTDWKDWEEGGDAMSDMGFRYPIRVKANYGPARTGHAFFTTINGEVTTVTINQAAFSLPVIHRRHYGMTFRSYGMDQGRNMTNWMMNVMSNNVNDLGEDEFNFAETCHGEPFPNELCVTTGYYYWGGWGVIDGRVAINEWVGENNASIPSVTAMIPPIIAETDEYYLPVTAIAIKSCSADLETRQVDVTVEVYAAKAGTYLLRGHLLDRSSSYTPGGAMYRAGMRNTIMKFFTSPKGDKLVFDTDRSTKTLSYSVTAPDEFSYGEVGGWGKLEDELVMFFTEVPFPAGCRVNATAESNMHGHYIDNSRFAEFGDVQELEVTP